MQWTIRLAFSQQPPISPNQSPKDNNPNESQQKLLQEYEAFANELADAARNAILPYWRLPASSLEIESKYESGRSASQTISPVTAADRAAERTMRTLIEDRYPSHGIIGEEYGSVRTDTADWVWVLDPIDGTKSFMTGKPLFGTLIGGLYKGIPTLGVLDQCILEERWVGVAGKQTLLNGSPVSCCSRSTPPSPDKLKDAIMYTTTPDMFTQPYESKRFAALQSAVGTINYGADCYGYALVASGFGAHLVVEADLGLYDYCAIVPIMEGAGGIITDWRGEKLRLDNVEECRGRVVACSNEALHKEAVQILSERRPLRARVVESATGSFPSLLVGVFLGKIWSWIR